MTLVERLGWTLIHFLWQGLSLAILYAAARRMLRTSTPNARYVLACAALALMIAAPLVTWEVLRPVPMTAGIPIPSVSTSATVIATPQWGGPPGPRGTPWPGSSEFLPYVVAVWLAGALILWTRLMGAWILTARLRSRQVRPAPPEWQQSLQVLSKRIRLTRPVQLLISAMVQVPTVVGWLRPVVLVPVGALAGLPPDQVEALLLHELAHIRRHDYLVNILQSIAEAFLFYHPAVWWVSKHIRAERELCCDDIAVSATGDVLTYARALAQVESYRPAHVALAANGGSLADRIARLLGRPRPAAARAGVGPGALAIALLLVAAAYSVFGQPAAHRAFQTVSIRRSPNWSDRAKHGMGLGVNSSLLLLIQFAYAPHDNPMLGHSAPLPASQIIGGPSWIDSEGYDIQVKAPPQTDPKQEWQMWQTLLADRFQLKLHRETRDLPIYELTLAKSGSNLPPAKPADCVSFPIGTKPQAVPGKVDCGYVSGPMGGYTAGLRIAGRRVRVSDLARELSMVLNQPVVDKTGFTGDFDLNLTYQSNGLAAAIEQQLGLKLVSVKAPVEVLVVDHAERPATN